MPAPPWLSLAHHRPPSTVHRPPSTVHRPTAHRPPPYRPPTTLTLPPPPSQVSGRYPERVTVVSFGFKKRRFVELHRAALRFPRAAFTYVGIDPPGLPLDVLAGELAHSSKPFERDPYGCAEAELRRKRATRDPFRRGARYAEGCPAMAPLLEHCEPSTFRGPLPWSARLGDDDAGAFGSRRRHLHLAGSSSSSAAEARTARDLVEASGARRAAL